MTEMIREEMTELSMQLNERAEAMKVRRRLGSRSA